MSSGTFRTKAVTSVERSIGRIGECHEQLLRLGAGPGDEPAVTEALERLPATRRTASRTLAAEQWATAVRQAGELGRAALHFTEAGAGAGTEVRRMLRDATDLGSRRRRHELRSYVRRLARLAAECEQATRYAVEAHAALPAELRARTP